MHTILAIRMYCISWFGMNPHIWLPGKTLHLFLYQTLIFVCPILELYISSISFRRLHVSQKQELYLIFFFFISSVAQSILRDHLVKLFDLLLRT